MEKFKLIITETLEKEIEVEAESLNEAFDIVEKQYQEGKICLDEEVNCTSEVFDKDFTKQRVIYI